MERSPSGHTSWTPLVAIALCACAAYGTSFFGTLVFDDRAVLMADPAVKSLDAWLRDLGHGLRPLLKLTYLGNWALDGVPGFHAVNLCIHLATTIVVFFIAQRAAASAPAWWRGTPAWWRGAPFWAAALFAVHPVHTEAVTYISGRSSSLAALFCGLSLLCCAAREGRGGRVMTHVLSPLLFLAAVLTKETAIVLPAGLFWWIVCINRKTIPGACARLWVHGVVVLGATGLVLANTRMFGLALEAVGRVSPGDGLLRQAHGAVYLVSRLVFVNRLCIDPALDVLRHGALAGGLATAFCLTLCAGAVFLARRLPAAAFGLGWCMLFLYLQYVVLPRPDVINERHMYLANMGLFPVFGLLVARAFSAVPERMTGWILVSGGTVLLVLLIATSLRSLQYRDGVRLWSSTVSVAPHNARGWNNLGLALEREHAFVRARGCYETAVALDHGSGPSAGHLIRVRKRIELDR